MTTVREATPSERAPAAEIARPRVSWRGDLMTVGLAAWLMVGLFVDGWAHTNLTQLETFFTPWHALFYSGFTATAAWVMWQVVRNSRSGAQGPAAIPVGYGLGVVGIGIFLVGGIGDFTWHSIFGIEQNIDALLSPTHLVLATGIMLIMTSPLRAAWASPEPGRPGLTRLLPVVLSLALATALVAFFLMYASMFRNSSSSLSAADFISYWAHHGVGGRGFLHSTVEDIQVVGMVSVLVTSIVLVAPVLLMLRRWRLPFGTVTLMYTLPALLLTAIDEFELAFLVLAAFAAGVIGDILVKALRPSSSRAGACRITAALLALPLTGLYFLAIELKWGIGWPAELWTGITLLSGIATFGLAVLMWPPSLPAGVGREE